MTLELRMQIVVLSNSVFFFHVFQMRSFYRAVYLSDPDVKIVGKNTCHWCNEAKKLLESRKIMYRWEDVNPETFTFDSVPQIWIGGVHVGGYTELKSVIDSLLPKTITP